MSFVKYVIVFSIFFTSCNYEVKKKEVLISKWNLDQVEYVEMKKFAPDAVNEGAYFDFKENDKFEMNNYLQGKTFGKWTLSYDTLKIERQNETIRFIIEKLEPNELVLLLNIDEETLKFYLKRVIE